MAERHATQGQSTPTHCTQTLVSLRAHVQPRLPTGQPMSQAHSVRITLASVSLPNSTGQKCRLFIKKKNSNVGVVRTGFFAGLPAENILDNVKPGKKRNEKIVTLFLDTFWYTGKLNKTITFFCKGIHSSADLPHPSDSKVEKNLKFRRFIMNISKISLNLLV
jgi:hypothetical protein